MASDIVLRSLATPAELDAWFDLCATAFAAKGTPRSHFESHWRDDPHADLRSVFVADTSSGAADAAADAFVSSVRVFARHIYLGGDRLVFMGGIGEVGTRPSFAGRGLATRLLGLALDHMAERHTDVAGLHSSHVRRLERIFRNAWHFSV
jgi:GNAT superfamily N-acetyltransferase